MHVIWFAPFYSGGGYCTEAQAAIASMHQYLQSSFKSSNGNSNFSFGMSHHGDSVNSEYLQHGLSKNEKALYKLYSTYDQFSGPPTKTLSISVCHSEPGAWYVPHPKYHTTPCPPQRSGYRLLEAALYVFVSIHIYKAYILWFLQSKVYYVCVYVCIYVCMYIYVCIQIVSVFVYMFRWNSENSAYIYIT